MKKVKKLVLYTVVVIVVIGSGILIKSKLFTDKKNTTTAVTASKTSVEVQIAKTVEKNFGDIYKATLEAYQQGMITSKISAKVLSVSVENGQYVNSGDTIATLDDQDTQNNIETAQAQLQVYQKQLEANQQQVNQSEASMEKIKVNLDDAQRNYDRQKTLFDSKVISQAELEAAEKALNTAKADCNTQNASIQASQASVGIAQANIEAQKVNIEKYKSDLSNTTIKAPISGIISDKNINVGQMATQGGVLAKINDISSVYATIQVPQEKISGVTIGQAATIAVDGSDKTYNGTVQNIDLSADAASRVFNVKVKIDNSDKSLLPGIYGKVTLTNGQKTDIITVPINALVGNEGDYSIFINDNGTAKKAKVTIGETDENNVEITSGLNDGDQIICTNTSTIQDGDAINAVSKQDDDSEDTASK